MFQSLLEHRFKLEIHRETRDLPLYELTIAKGKSRLTPSSDAQMSLTVEGKHWNQQQGTCGVSMWLEGAHLVCHAASMDKILPYIIAELHAPLVDRTGLTGTYDLNVRYVPDGATMRVDTEAGPSFLQAFPDDTGIKLEKGKGPVEVMTIDRMGRPSENQ